MYKIHGFANVLAQYAAALQSVIYEFEIENYWMHKGTKCVFMELFYEIAFHVVPKAQCHDPICIITHRKNCECCPVSQLIVREE